MSNDGHSQFSQPFHNVNGLLLIYCLFFRLDGERCDRHSRGYFGGDCNQCSTTGWGRYRDKTTFLIRTFVQDAHLLPLLRRTFDGTFQAGQHTDIYVPRCWVDLRFNSREILDFLFWNWAFSLVCDFPWTASPLLLKNNSDTPAEAHVAKDCDGKSYTHSCCSWKIIP